ncbi:MAG TPA: endonuclease/exonuclease/phosphatase family protein [Solirubrobacteraceae bacterium]
MTGGSTCALVCFLTRRGGACPWPSRRSRSRAPSCQAQVVHDFVGKILDVDGKADVVVLGDLNDFQFSPSVAALRTGTADGSGPSILTDLIAPMPKDQQYTYVFNGVSQVLDHILVTRGLGDVQYQVVHVNAEYHDQASDHDPQVVRVRP